MIRRPSSWTLAAANLRLGRGGRLEVPVTIEHRNGHTRSVALSADDLPQGVDASFRDGPDGERLLVLRAADDIDPSDATMTVRGTDGELSRSMAVDFRLAGGPRIDFSAPTGGPLLVDPDTDVIPVAFTEPGGDPASRRIQRQWGPARTPGSCGDARWRDDGDAVPPDDLDPDGSSEDSWSFEVDPADLTRGDGCYRWLVILSDDDGDPTMWASGAALVDGEPPGAPSVEASGSHVYQSGNNKTVWVRKGSGTVELSVSGRDEGAGVTETRFGPLSTSTGWDAVGPTVVAGDPASKDLDWSSSASGTTTLDVSTTDAMGLDGPARTVTIKVDGTAPSAARWLAPTGFFRVVRQPGASLEGGHRLGFRLVIAPVDPAPASPGAQGRQLHRSELVQRRSCPAADAPIRRGRPGQRLLLPLAHHGPRPRRQSRSDAHLGRRPARWTQAARRLPEPERGHQQDADRQAPCV